MTKNAKLELLMGFYKTHNLFLSWYQVEVLQRSASRIQKNAEHYCNGVIDSDQWEKIQRQAIARMKKTFITMPEITIQGDPRGYCLKLKTPHGDEIAPHHFN